MRRLRIVLVAFVAAGLGWVTAAPVPDTNEESPADAVRAFTQARLTPHKSRDEIRRALTRIVEARVRVEGWLPDPRKACPASSDTNPGSVRIRVIDRDGPIRGATVVIARPGLARVGWSGDAAVEWGGLPPGAYVVSVKKDRMLPYESTICVTARKLTQLNAGLITGSREEIAVPWQPAPPRPVTTSHVAGVDEGGIVKARPGGLLVLRRGRLFSIDADGAAPRVVSAVAANAPGAKPALWYNELLFAGGRAVVIGYGTDEGAYEFNVFDVDTAGALSFRASARVRGGPWWSAREFDPHLVGERLIFYMPVPALAAWQKIASCTSFGEPEWQQERSKEWRPLLEARDVFGPVQPTEWPVYHTVVTCRISDTPLACTARAVVAPEAQEFFVADRAVYVWSGERSEEVLPERGAAPSSVYRIPFDGSAPRAIGAWGSPIDQFSFHEGDDKTLHVLVASGGGPDSDSQKKLAIANLPLAAFSTAPRVANGTMYVSLPTLGSRPVTDRFVGDWLLFGSTSYGFDREPGAMYAHAWRRRAGTTSMLVSHSIEHVEPLGVAAACVIGRQNDELEITMLALDGGAPVGVAALRLVGATGGPWEALRSLAFDFRATGTRDGTFGVPVMTADQSAADDVPTQKVAAEKRASIAYVRVDRTHLVLLGSLAAHASAVADDACVTSCSEWYGNARPVFRGDRIFALLGYELVEGRIEGAQIVETGRLDFTPRREDAQR